MEKMSISSISLEHLHEDPMKGIRDLTNRYCISEGMNIHEKVIMYELERFDHELNQHSKLEDQVLFTKALSLETKIKKEFSKKAILN